jgi:hypothetical protein
MRIQIIETGIIQAYGQWRLANSNVSMPAVLSEETLASVGIRQVTETPAPATDDLHVAVENGVDESCVLQWKIIDRFASEEDKQAFLAKKAETDRAALVRAVTVMAQRRLDDFAKTRNYDGILSLCSYATDPNPRFAAEGQYGVEARSDTWGSLYSIMSAVEAGTRPMPSSVAEVEAELPVLTWPA